MTTLPSFEEFFSGVHRYPPFPWQERLAGEVLENGWPDLLDLPTGAGKTSALDVALYCLASRPDRLPRRTVLVVDRRIVVDQGAEHARKILKVLRTAADGPVKVVADALRAIWSTDTADDPFAVAIMRGGMPRDNDWARRPDQPVLGVSTVDQVGSRLLFRGYGVSPKSASIHAGLLGNDTLILLDEVHLAVPFEQTLSVIRKHFRHPCSGLPDRFGVVRMSATAGTVDPQWRTFRLANDDRANPVLSRRLRAQKRARLQVVKVTGDDESAKRRRVAESAVAAALALQSNTAKLVAIVVNRVDTARLACQVLREKHGTTTDAVLVTGRMRPIDRDHMVRDTLWRRVGPHQQRAVTDRPLIVVATQCIEAGADLDFDAMVTECASLDALRQRFGRLDRQGDRRVSQAVILGRSDATMDGSYDPIYDQALSATWSWLKTIAQSDEVDFGIEALPTPLDKNGEPRSDLVARPSDAPILLPAHLDAWAQTTPLPAIDPDASLWLHGPAKPADVQIVWRSDVALPNDADGEETSLERAIQSLSARRPSSLEAISVPIGAARRWLAGEPTSAIADVMSGDAEEPNDKPRRSSTPRPEIVALRWAGEDSEFVTQEDRLRPGDVLIVPCDRGGIAAGNFDPNSEETVIDVGDLAQLRARGIASLLLTSDALTVWQLPVGMNSVPAPIEDESLKEARKRVRLWLRGWPPARPESNPVTDSEWGALIDTLASTRVRVSVVGGSLVVSAAVPRERRRSVEVGDAISEDDDSSFRSKAITIRAHCGDVRGFADHFATSLGFSDELVNDLGLAAWLHDIGKADPRFQQLLAGGSEVALALSREPLAKSALPGGSAKERKLARQRAGYPQGYRHELLSLGMIEETNELLARAHDRDLVLHLIASHHGWCRPFAPMVDHSQNDLVELDHDGVHVSGHMRHRKARLDSGVGNRFWSLVEKYGWWGLAWLEAVTRLADHRASELETGAGE